jgi:D-glycero-alpha-D-manno-heptose 1-phosphate guanylyltransferase
MIKEAIILAGGLGTRLRSVVSDVPKCVAPVAGKPFLEYIIDYLQKEGVTKFIFSVGYKKEIIIDFINSQFSSAKDEGNFQFSTEQEPLGTGGAIKLACSKATEKTVLIVNGDTLFKIDVNKLTTFHEEYISDCTLSLKPLQNFDRYGVVQLNEDYSIKSFNEKKFYETGLINGGMYALEVSKFLQEDLPEKFSFEKDYLEKSLSLPKRDKRRMYALIQDVFFIDIGIPEDYQLAQSIFKDT